MRNLFIIHSEFSAHSEIFGIAFDHVTFLLRHVHILFLSVTRGQQVSIFISEICYSGFSDISMSPDSAVRGLVLV